jgi:hypothetical protein
MRRRRDADAWRSRRGCGGQGPLAGRRGARARTRARNAQRDLVVVLREPRVGRTQLTVNAERRWAAGGRDRGSDLAVRRS